MDAFDQSLPHLHLVLEWFQSGYFWYSSEFCLSSYSSSCICRGDRRLGSLWADSECRACLAFEHAKGMQLVMGFSTFLFLAEAQPAALRLEATAWTCFLSQRTLLGEESMTKGCLVGSEIGSCSVCQCFYFYSPTDRCRSYSFDYCD